MYENMTGFVGYATHEDRQRQARKNRLAREAANPVTSSWNAIHRRYHEAVAAMLMAIAVRLAPTETTLKPDVATATHAR